MPVRPRVPTGPVGGSARTAVPVRARAQVRVPVPPRSGRQAEAAFVALDEPEAAVLDEVVLVPLPDVDDAPVDDEPELVAADVLPAVVLVVLDVVLCEESFVERPPLPPERASLR